MPTEVRSWTYCIFYTSYLFIQAFQHYWSKIRYNWYECMIRNVHFTWSILKKNGMTFGKSCICIVCIWSLVLSFGRTIFYHSHAFHSAAFLPLLMVQSSHGVQRRMISVDNFFRIFEIIIFLLCCCYMWPSARCGNYISPFLCVNSIKKSFLKYEWCPWNCKLQFHGHHSYFRKDFQMLLTLKEGHM